MNSVACASKVLERIVENMHTFEESQNITAVIDSVSEIGCFALKKSLPCSFLRNVFLILNKFRNQIVNSRSATKFFLNVDHFYKASNLTSNLKCLLLAYFPPATETEVLTLLNMCATISNIEDLTILKTAVAESCLPPACAENSDMFHKVNCILKKAFTVSQRNPVVGFLSSVFAQAVRNASMEGSCIHLFPDEFCHLEILFSLPQQFFCEQQQIDYVKYLLNTLVNTVEINLCDSTDVVFLCAIFPSLYHQAMTYFINETFDAYKFLRIVYNVNSELKTAVDYILKNQIWRYFLES